jgi:hypothetical protein
VNTLALDPTGTTMLYAGLGGGSVWQLHGSADFFTVTPCRVFDSRDPLRGGGAALVSGSTTSVPFASRCGVPTTATAVAINVTMTAPSGSGYLTLFPDGTPRPLVSAVNYAAGQTRANSAVAPLGPSGMLNVFVGQASGEIHVIIDVNGYFQ